MPTPLVSILVPTYNRAPVIRETLSSILGQSYEHLEVLVADDCSTDGNFEIVQEATAGDPRVRCWRNEQNLGGFNNAMQLWHAARGEYVKMVMDDDLLLPRHVETLLAPMLDDPSISISTSKRALVDERGRRLADTFYTQPIVAQEQVLPGIGVGDLCLRKLANWVGEQTTVLFPRRLVAPTRMFHFGGVEISGASGDLSLFLALLARGKCFYTPDAQSCLRLHHGQVSQRPRVRMQFCIDWLEMMERGWRYYGYLQERAHRVEAYTALAALCATTIRDNADDPDVGRVLQVLERTTDDIRALHGQQHGAAPQRGAASDRLIGLSATGSLVTADFRRRESPAAMGDGPAPRVPLPGEADRCTIVLVLHDDAGAAATSLQGIADCTPGEAYDVLLVDDAADDAVRELVEALDGDVTIRRHERRRGLASSWQEAAEAASGEVVVLLRAGFAVTPGWLATIVNAFEEPDVGVVGGSIGGPVPADDGDWSGVDVTAVDAVPVGLVALRRGGAAAGAGADDAAGAAADEDEPELAICARARAAGQRVLVDPTCVLLPPPGS